MKKQHKHTRTLQHIYDHQAEQFSQTRTRSRPEFPHLLSRIKKNFPTKKNLRILEFGCGDGRFLSYLKEHHPISYTYVGVDISLNLLKIADKNHSDARRVHKDMNEFLMTNTDTFDICIGIASFHHLPTKYARASALAAMYECLEYNGILLMTNRCYSDWFNKKYALHIAKAKRKSILSLGWFNANDIFIPRFTPQKKHIGDRLYHIFSQKELSTLCKNSGFSSIDHIYIGSQGELSESSHTARNLITICKKSIYKEDN